VDRHLTNPGRCVCDPNAFGQACEFLKCPNDCQSSMEFSRGICDHATGTCKCIPGYQGVDCSGQEGDCYMSFDGTCRQGWTPGKYILNGADTNNMNYGTGLLPRALRCDEQSELLDRNVFGCSMFAALEFCCRASEPPTCPFSAGSTLCNLQDCIEQHWLPKNGTECDSALGHYCFFNATDPACNYFGTQAPPADFCPSALAWAHCAEHEHTANPECASLVPDRPICNFHDVDSSPCKVEACTGLTPQGTSKLFSGVCYAYIQVHCDEHPDDRECELFLLGDQCRFDKGSQPCEDPVCIEDLDSIPCLQLIDFYCSSIKEVPDYECQLRGYMPRPDSSLPLTADECPWEAVYAYCADHPETALCTQMHLYGVLESQRPAQENLPMAESLFNMATEEGKAALDAFAVTSIGLDNARGALVERTHLYNELFFFTDRNLDGTLNAEETKELLSEIDFRNQQGQGTVLKALSRIQLKAALDAYAAGSGFLTQEDLRAALDSALGF